MIQAATGAGKSLIIAEICHRLNEPVLILQPTKELLEQNYAKLESYGVEDIAIYSASKGVKEIGKYTYATINSIYRHPEKFKHFKYVIIDECHQVNPKNLGGMYASFLEAIGATNVCGLTATPYRVVSGYVRDDIGELYYTAKLQMINRIKPFFFRKIAFKIETEELIKRGYLSPIKYHINPANLEKLVVNSTGADYTEESVAAWSKDQTSKIVEMTKFSAKHAERTLVFCANTKQAYEAYDALRAVLTDVFIVTAQTDVEARERAVELFKIAQGAVLINVGVFTTGFDVPELNSIILGRPTMSLALYYQMVGRGVRLDPADPAKVLRVFDLAGVVERLGRVETIKLGKEQHPTMKGFYMDTIESERGRLDNKPLFTFHVKKDMFKRKD